MCTRYETECDAIAAKQQLLIGDTAGFNYDARDIVFDGDKFVVSVKDYKNICASVKQLMKGYRVPLPVTQPWNDSTVPINPYLLGLWLGGGYSNAPVIVGCDDEIKYALESIAFSMGLTVTTTVVSVPGQVKNDVIATRSTYEWTLVNSNSNKPDNSNSLTAALRAMGLINNKHIPAVYLNASASIRRDLLAGLLDTDGYLMHSNRSYVYEFLQSAARETLLISDTMKLAGSLGMQVSPRYLVKRSAAQLDMGMCQDDAGGHIYYQVYLGGEEMRSINTRVPRKNINMVAPDQTFYHTYCSTIQVKESSQQQFCGIQVDGNNRFLLADATVVHNWYVMSYMYIHIYYYTTNIA